MHRNIGGIIVIKQDLASVETSQDIAPLPNKEMIVVVCAGKWCSTCQAELLFDVLDMFYQVNDQQSSDMFLHLPICSVIWFPNCKLRPIVSIKLHQHLN